MAAYNLPGAPVYNNPFMNPYAPTAPVNAPGALDQTGQAVQGAAAYQGGPNYLGDMSMVGGGKGKDFTAYRQAQALDTLGKGVSSGEGDQGVRAALRNQIMQQISNLQNNQNTANGQFASQMDRGLNNSLAMARRQMAGTGLSGSQQAGANLGSIVGNAQAARSQGLLNLQNQGIAQLQGLTGTEQGVLGQSLAERGYNLNQANTLAQLLQQQAGLEQGSILGTMQQAGPSDFEKGLGYLFSGAGAAGGLMSGLGALG